MDQIKLTTFVKKTQKILLKKKKSLASLFLPYYYHTLNTVTLETLFHEQNSGKKVL